MRLGLFSFKADWRDAMTCSRSQELEEAELGPKLRGPYDWLLNPYSFQRTKVNRTQTWHDTWPQQTLGRVLFPVPPGGSSSLKLVPESRNLRGLPSMEARGGDVWLGMVRGVISLEVGVEDARGWVRENALCTSSGRGLGAADIHRPMVSVLSTLRIHAHRKRRLGVSDWGYFCPGTRDILPSLIWGMFGTWREAQGTRWFGLESGRRE